MSKKAVDKLFEAMYNLTDLREIFRKTSPKHELNGEQEEKVEDLIKKVEKDLEIIEEEILE
jgi:hypothetical protein